MTKSALAHDLGRDLQQQIGALVERKLALAQQVLEPFELGILLLEAAASLSLTAAATVAAMAQDGPGRAEMFDVTLEAIAAASRGDRERSLAAIAKREAAGGAA